MKIEFDAERDLLYVYFADVSTKVAKTLTVNPGVNVDFDKNDKLIGMEVIDASEIIGEKIEFKLPEVIFSKTKDKFVGARP